MLFVINLLWLFFDCFSKRLSNISPYGGQIMREIIVELMNLNY